MCEQRQIARLSALWARCLIPQARRLMAFHKGERIGKFVNRPQIPFHIAHAIENSIVPLGVAQQLLDQAKRALDLAQTRYNLGLGSIVELSQAQLQETQAEISEAQAGYSYRLALSLLRYQTEGL